MFAVQKLADVSEYLSGIFGERIQVGKLPQVTEELRGPVGLFLVREDGAHGSKLAQEIVGSFGYWHGRSGHFFDGVFLGWGFDACPVFMEKEFCQCIVDLESCTKWKYQGGSQLILTDFVYDPNTGRGRLDFSKAIPLDISGLLDEKKLAQLSPLIEELIAPVSNQREVAVATSVCEISDYVALLRGRRVLWKKLVKKMGVLLELADAVAPYAVRDLRKEVE